MALAGAFLFVILILNLGEIKPEKSPDHLRDLKTPSDITLTPHKALYKIKLVSSKSGSQVINVSGDMYYELNKTCDAWITDHRFKLRYDYVNSSPLQIKSNFSTYESFDGKSFHFTSRRKRGGVVYEEIEGVATMPGHEVSLKEKQQGGRAVFEQPEGLSYDLPSGTYFPINHTLAILKEAKKGKNFFQSVVFDGSDDTGPVTINAFIGDTYNAIAELQPSAKIDTSLLNTSAWKMRLAFFPLNEDSVTSDYEMEMIFHDNGVVSDMLVEYKYFSVTQSLVALEHLGSPNCE